MEKTIEIFLGSLKYDAKHWASDWGHFFQYGTKMKMASEIKPPLQRKPMMLFAPNDPLQIVTNSKTKLN